VPNLRALFRQWKEAWSKFNPFTRRLLLGGGLALLFSLIIYAFLLGQGPAYAPVFSGLQAKDAAEIIQKLETQKVPYRLADNGRAILVPEKDVYRIRLSLAAQGLPRGGVVGFELMDQSRFGATEFDRRVNYQRALEGELTRTIMELTQVAEARVHIVLPEPSLFVSQKKPATAAILVKLKPGQELSPDQVSGIIHLVSRSVEGLQKEDVTVVDDSGRILSNDLQLDPANSKTVKTSSNYDLQQRFERELGTSLQSLLEQVLGRGNVVARVKAELNFDEKTVERNFFEPAADQQKLLRSVQELQETFKGTGTPPGGGTATNNIPSYPVASSATSSDYQKTQSTRNYELNEIREKTVVAPGTVKRLSVAVVVNKELTAKEQDAITKVVSSAIGLDQARQDQITVTGMAFNNALLEALRAPAPAAPPSPWTWPKVNPVYLAAGLGAALILLLVLVLLVRRRRRLRKRLEEETRQLLEEQMAAAKEEAQKTPPPEVSPAERWREEIERLVKQNPEGVAQVIKAWLAEE